MQRLFKRVEIGQLGIELEMPAWACHGVGFHYQFGCRTFTVSFLLGDVSFRWR